MSFSFQLTSSESDSREIPLMERAPLKFPTATTFGSFPPAPGYHTVLEQVQILFFKILFILLTNFRAGLTFSSIIYLSTPAQNT